MTTESNIHTPFMQRCLQLAECGRGLTYPNPMVGCVIVCDGVIIGEGYHVRAGMPHAEVNAIRSVRRRELLSRSTLYVSLEPCAHFGRTPPCAGLIIDSHIPHVVVGCVDSFAQVSGRGIRMLTEAGVKVEVGILSDEARRLNGRFFTFNELHRPYVVLKWAQSLDGFIDEMRDISTPPAWLTNGLSRTMVHRQRTQEQAIMVGTNTALFDDPQLTARLWHGNQPLRVVLDNRLRLPASTRLLADGGRTLVINSIRQCTEGNVEYARTDFGSNLAHNVAELLYERGIQSVVVEGGRRTLQTFIDAGLWDEAYVYYGSRTLTEGIEAPRLRATPAEIRTLGDVRLAVFKR